MSVLPSSFLGSTYSVNTFFLFFSLTEMRIFKVSRAYFQTAIENDSFILTSFSLNLKRAAERTKNVTQMKNKNKTLQKVYIIVVKQNVRKKNKNKKLYLEQHIFILSDTIVCVCVFLFGCCCLLQINFKKVAALRFT